MKTNKPTDSKAFTEAILSLDKSSIQYRELWYEFGKEMRKATEGRIATPERMAILYPIFREINEEQDHAI